MIQVKANSGRGKAVNFARAAAVAAVALASTPAMGGEVRGTVRFSGPVPPPEPLAVVKDQGTCGKQVPDESLLVSGGRVENAVVTVQGSTARPAPGKVVLDQQRCRFVPHVLAAALGSTLEIVNGDPVLHNVHGYRGRVTAFDVAMPSRDQRVSRKLEKPGVVVVRCDVHAWMTAYVVVADGPFAVTGADGGFVIRDLPAGRYAVTAWHERLGEKTVEVVVPAEGAAAADFLYGK
jgi:plastocyanin